MKRSPIALGASIPPHFGLQGSLQVQGTLASSEAFNSQKLSLRMINIESNLASNLASNLTSNLASNLVSDPASSPAIQPSYPTQLSNPAIQPSYSAQLFNPAIQPSYSTQLPNPAMQPGCSPSTQSNVSTSPIMPFKAATADN